MMDTGSTAWILTSIALVLLMTPGLAFFYCGLVRERQVVNTIKMSFVALGIIAIEWALIGYSMAFAEGNALVGGLGWIGLSGVGTAPEPSLSGDVPHIAFMAFQMMFAIITPALISGAVVGRMKFKAYVLFILLWGVVVYNPLAHWVWGPAGWIKELGALDFAGGTVVHVSAGVSALVAALILGPRRGVDAKGGSEGPHNVPFVVLGASLLWFGWFGFNGGSALAADGLAALAVVNTMLGAAAAVVAWITLDVWSTGRATATGSAIGAVVGLVAITPGAGFVAPLSAIAIGALAAGVSFATLAFLGRTRLDDTLDVFACHGMGGVVGSILTGVFASNAMNPGVPDGLVYGNPALMNPQIVSVLAAGGFAAAGTAGILFVVNQLVGLRASDEADQVGIDLVEHRERAYRRDATGGFAAVRDVADALASRAG
jgi:Amt family ammonium transporter